MIKNKMMIALCLLGVFLVHNIEAKSSSLVGKPAYIFSASAVDGDKEITFNLKDYIGKYDIVLYFYPMDNTPGCTRQAKIFRDNIQKLKEKGILVVGISCDSVASHQKFQKQYALPYILISDSRWFRSIAKQYHASGFLYAKRKTILIDKKGTIVHVFDKVNIQDQIDDILKVFHA